MSRGGVDVRAKAAAYRAWGWHLSHASRLERSTPGAGGAYLRHVTGLLEDAKAGELSRLSAFPGFPQGRKAS